MGQLGSPTTRRGRRGAGGAGAAASVPRSADGWEHQSSRGLPRETRRFLHQAGRVPHISTENYQFGNGVLGDGRPENAVPDG